MGVLAMPVAAPLSLRNEDMLAVVICSDGLAMAKEGSRCGLLLPENLAEGRRNGENKSNGFRRRKFAYSHMMEITPQN